LYYNEETLLIGNSNSESSKLAISLFVSTRLVEGGFDGKKTLASIGDEVSEGGFKVGGRIGLAQAGGLKRNLFEKVLSSLKKYIATRKSQDILPLIIYVTQIGHLLCI
jgi:hypothetical protein